MNNYKTIYSDNKCSAIQKREDSLNAQIFAQGGLRLKGNHKNSLSNKLLVSIITATFNRKDYLEETIQSVINQSYHNIEYVIIDGGSTDGTLDIIKKYDDKIDFWISRPDNSMYEAINDGIKNSNGDIIAILNSDDKYIDGDVIENIINEFNKEPNIDGIYGNLIRLYEDRIRHKRLFQVNYEQYLISGKGTFVPHSTLFVKRELIEKVGLYDTRYRYASDYDFILKCLKKGTLKYINKSITYFREHNNSITATDNTITPETFDILKAHKLGNVNFIYRFAVHSYLWCKYKYLNS